jgi:hypothetical protein
MFPIESLSKSIPASIASASVVFKSIKNSPYNYKLLLAYAAKKNYIDLLPQAAQDIFIF